MLQSVDWDSFCNRWILPVVSNWLADAISLVFALLYTRRFKTSGAQQSQSVLQSQVRNTKQKVIKSTTLLFLSKITIFCSSILHMARTHPVFYEYAKKLKIYFFNWLKNCCENKKFICNAWDITYRDSITRSFRLVFPSICSFLYYYRYEVCLLNTRKTLKLSATLGGELFW
jgi:hypothetical protein